MRQRCTFFDLLCQNYKWLLLWFCSCQLLRLGPALLQWHLQSVLRGQ
jgi:hypothetical protein